MNFARLYENASPVSRVDPVVIAKQDVYIVTSESTGCGQYFGGRAVILRHTHDFYTVGNLRQAAVPVGKTTVGFGNVKKYPVGLNGLV